MTLFVRGKGLRDRRARVLFGFGIAANIAALGCDLVEGLALRSKVEFARELVLPYLTAQIRGSSLALPYCPNPGVIERRDRIKLSL